MGVIQIPPLYLRGCFRACCSAHVFDNPHCLNIQGCQTMKSAVQRSVLGAVVVFLASCGSGGGGSAVPSAPLVQGTAALGSAVANAKLNLKCAAGERSATTGPDGRYQIDIAELTPPCMMTLSGGQVAGVDNLEVLSTPVVAAGVVNITPWTHLIMARLMGAEPTEQSNLTPTDLQTKFTKANVAQATEGIRLEVGRLLGSPPNAELDPVHESFSLEPGKGMSGLLDQIMNGLKGAQKTLPQAAREVAVGPLQIVGVSANCKPGVLSGFAGGYTDVPVQVPLPAPADPGNPGDAGDGGGGGGGDGGSAGGGSGAGAGASLGQFLNTLVRAERSDGTLIGQATTDKAKGMVTVITCGYQGPVHISMQAKPDGTSQYYEESTGKYAAYPAGEEMHAVVPMVNKNMGLTLLTEAAWQYMLVKHGPDGWKSAANVSQANQFIGTEFNKFLPKDLQITDITRLPFLVSDTTKAGTLTTSPNDVYGLVSSGLARAAGLMRAGDLAPALKLVRQLGKDLCDGVIDLTCNGVPVVADSKDAAYLPPQFAGDLNRGIGDVAAACGNAGSGDAAFRVTQMSLDMAPQPGGPYGGYAVSSYNEGQNIHLLRSDGRVFFWPTRADKPMPFLPEYNFSRLFNQTGEDVAGVVQGGVYVTMITRDRKVFPIKKPELNGATTVAGYSLADTYSAQITRLPNGRAHYYPHWNAGDLSLPMLSKETVLGDITTVAASFGEEYLGDWDRTLWSQARVAPTFYASTTDGSVYAWGNDRYGGLADGKPIKLELSLSASGTGEPKKVMGLPPAVSVVGRRSGAFALDAQGRVWGWGAHELGVKDFSHLWNRGGLGWGTGFEQSLLPSTVGGAEASSVPVLIAALKPFGSISQISCGWDRTCAALTRAGELLVWGLFGEESYLMPPERQVPYKAFGVTKVVLPQGRRVTYLGASQHTIYAVLDDGKLVVFPTYPTAPQFIDTKAVLSQLSADPASSTCIQAQP
jgi:hypothetical protein